MVPCGTAQDLEDLGLIGGAEDPGFDGVDAAELLDRILSRAHTWRPRFDRVVTGVLAGETLDDLAAAEGLSRSRIGQLREEFRGDLAELDRAVGLLEGYPELRRAAQRWWRPREDRAEARTAQQAARRADEAHARAGLLESLRADARRLVLEGRVLPVGRVGEPVVWVRPGLAARRGTVVECRRTRLVVELVGDGRRVAVVRPRLRATAAVDPAVLKLEHFLADSAMSEDELDDYRRLAR